MKKIVGFLLVYILAIGSVAVAQKTERIQPPDVYVRTARIAILSKQYKRAERNLAICLKNYPEYYQAHYLMGAIWADKDEIDSMVVEFDLARKYAGDKLKKDDRTKMVDIEQDKWEQNFNTGVTWINTADSLESEAGKSEDVTYGQKLREMAGKAFNESARAFHNCTILKHDEFRGWLNLGLVHDRKLEYQDAAEEYKKSEKLFHHFSLQDSTTDFYDTTLFYQGAGKITPLFKGLIKKFKKNKEGFRISYKGLLTALGGIYFELKEYENCIAIFRRMLGLYEEDLGALEYVGRSFQELGYPDEALKWTQLILVQNPDDKNRLFNVGVYWYKDGEENKNKYLSLLKEKLGGSDDPQLADDLARAKERYQTNFARAVETLNRVLELDTEDKDSWRLKGVALFFMDKYEEAIPVLLKVRELFPDDKTICQILGECYRNLKDIDKLLEITKDCGL